MRVNQRGEEVCETDFSLYGETPTPEELTQIVILLLEQLNFKAVKTNATKHGNVEIEVRPEGWDDTDDTDDKYKSTLYNPDDSDNSDNIRRSLIGIGLMKNEIRSRKLCNGPDTTTCWLSILSEVEGLLRSLKTK